MPEEIKNKKSKNAQNKKQTPPKWHGLSTVYSHAPNKFDKYNKISILNDDQTSRLIAKKNAFT